MNYTNGSTSKGTEQLQLLPAIIKYFCDLLFQVCNITAASSVGVVQLCFNVP